jgi:DNA-binding transcriptional regulator YiaG
VVEITEATRIRVIRALLGVSSRELAARIGITPNSLTSWEHGKSTPQREKRKALAAICQENGIAFLVSGCPVPMGDVMMTRENS